MIPFLETPKSEARNPVIPFGEAVRAGSDEFSPPKAQTRPTSAYLPPPFFYIRGPRRSTRPTSQRTVPGKFFISTAYSTITARALSF
ncbi:hypothetical protein N7475_001342 [Penicillium sp. IBT 31633x]|nr:hypothetical protein N7475_001342 [Penicillium sp. IBT 31633x]